MKKVFILIFLLHSIFIMAININDTVVSKKKLVLFENNLRSIENKVKENSIELKEANSLVTISQMYAKDADELISNWTKLIALVLTLAGITGFYGIKGYINTRMEKILNHEEDVITYLFNKHEVEKGLISESKILIINKKGTDINIYLKKALKEFSKKIDIEDVDDLQKHKFKYQFNDYDLVLFDNTNTKDDSKNWEEVYLKSNLAKIAQDVCELNVAFLFFGKVDGGFSKDPKLIPYLHLINYANSASTAFSNIIYLLNFRKVIIDTNI